MCTHPEDHGVVAQILIDHDGLQRLAEVFETAVLD